jgi:hypothetical protein
MRPIGAHQGVPERAKALNGDLDGIVGERYLQRGILAGIGK